MMKKTAVFTCMLCAAAISAMAQAPAATGPIYDEAEDTTHVVTISDIAKQQARVTSQHTTSSHFQKVWGYKSFFNISYMTKATLTPKENYVLGFDAINNNVVPEFKADYGVALQLGHNYNLLKKAIANTVNINIDYTYIDLSMAHYKIEPGTYVYNSNNKWTDSESNSQYSTDYMYMPWCLEKYDINYGMNIGPSLTIAPFNYINVPQLHFFRLNVYYHIGYQAGILWMMNNKEANQANADTQSTQYYDADPLKMAWQHGMTQSFGFSFSWKAIGIGFETRSDSRTYKSVDTSSFGGRKYKFDGKNSRIYLKICY